MLVLSSSELVTRAADPAPTDVLDPGLAFLRAHTGPLLVGDIVVIGGRRNAGKSHLALAMLSGMARARERAVYVPLEDGATRVARRLRSGYAVDGLDVALDVRRTSDALVAVIERTAVAGTRVWCVDYVQCVEYTGTAWSEASAIKLTIAQLEAAATAARGVLVLASQVKQPYGDDDGAGLPGAYACRGGASIEDAADIVLMVGDVRGQPRVRITKAKDAAVGGTFALLRDERTGVLREPDDVLQRVGGEADDDEW